jgi:hypothetical protein
LASTREIRATGDSTFTSGGITPVVCTVTHTRLSSSGVGACDTAMQKLLNRDVRDFGWEIAHAAVTRRPPISLDSIVPRTEVYTYDVGVWDLAVIQGPVTVAPCLTLELRFAMFASLYVGTRSAETHDARGE